MFSIRKAAYGDIDTIMEIEKNSFKEGVAEKRETYEQRINIFPDGFLVLIPDGEEKPAGYICGEIWNLEDDADRADFLLDHNPEDKHSDSGNMLYISSMGVLDSCRGKGFGKYLFSSLTTDIPEKYTSVDKIILIVSEKWLPARNIYKKQGFEEKFILAEFFTPEDAENEDGIVMIKEL